MSCRVTALPTGAFLAHNWSHTQLADIAAGDYSHHDGLDHNENGVADQLSASPTTYAEAVDLFNAAMALFNRHLGRYTVGRRLLAHLANDTTNVMAMGVLSAGSTYSDTTLAALITLTQQASVAFEAHRLETGGDYHSTNDTVSVLGTTATLTTYKDVAERLNLLKALINAHMASLTYHGSATTAISAANATEGDIDSCVTLANAIRTAWATHIASGAAHGGAAGDDVANTIASGAVAGIPSALTTFAASFKTAYNAHLGSVVFHEIADSSNTLAYGAISTYGGFLTAAQEVYTDLMAHINFAPKSQALRLEA